MGVIFGLFCLALVLGILWVWVIKPCWAFFEALCLKPFTKTFSIGVSVGNKLVPKPREILADHKGELTEGASIMEKVSSPEYLIADWVKSCSVKKIGYVLFRGYKDHLERCLVIEGNTSLQRQLGRRVQLSNLDGKFAYEDESYIRKTVEEVKKLAESSVSKLETKPAKSAEIVKTVKEPAIAASPIKTSNKEDKKAKPLETYKGYLISYGKAARHLSSKDNDGQEVSKEIEQFRVLIKGEDGIEESIWGQDLLRAIKDANISLNDMVEVVKTGKRQSGNSWKNLYAINKVA